jgi:hypothetical protein
VNKSLPYLLLAAISFLSLPQQIIAQESEQAEVEVVQKKKFARIKSTEKKIMMKALRLIEKGEVDNENDVDEISDGIASLIELGECVIPKCLTSFPRMAKVERQQHLTRVLDSILLDDELHIALELCNRKTTNQVYAYLMQRWTDSSREDREEVLNNYLSIDDEAVQYHCVRGLIQLGDKLMVNACVKIIDSQWKDNKQQLRNDFSGVSRGIMSELIAEKVSTPNKKVRLLGLHLFELFGLKEDASILADNLNNSDTALRLGAINACRVVIGGELPLLRPSMTELIELATEWSSKI